MTILIGDNSPRISYSVAEGVTQTTFTVPFEFFDSQDLNVYVDDVLKTLTTNYTVSGGNGSTGSITISVTGATGGSVVVITRSIALERTTDFPPTGPFQVGSLNTELDRIVAISADLQDVANRGLRLSDSDTTSTLILANKDARKGTVLAFNETTGDVEVGPSIADIQSVSDISADIAVLADIEDGTIATDAITTVASISTDVSTVSSNNANVTIVAGETTNMQNITDNLSDVQNAATNATNAATSASNALASEVAAAASEAAAGASETASGVSATNAASSASSASTSATNASNSASTASTSATNAAASASNASTSATNASASASSASSSASSASASASSASSSASSAASAQIAAESARDSALAAYDNFDDRYLGAKSSDPATDNDGNTLLAGALYFDTTSETMKLYTGSVWIAAYVAGSGFAPITGATFTGDVTVPNLVTSGNVDGRDVSVDGTKLDGIEAGATADQTGAEILSAISGETVASLTISSADINGGTVDGVTIGAASAGAGKFTAINIEQSAAGNFDSIILSRTTGNVGDVQSIVWQQNDLSNLKAASISGQVTGASAGALLFNTATGGTLTERARLDDLGNLLVGKTNTTNLLTTAGHVFYGNGEAFHTRAGNALFLGRTGSDGNIATFYKDGTTVGSIGSYSGVGLTIASGSELRFFTSTSNEDMRLETDGDLHVDGNVVAYSTTISDKRLKKDIQPIENALWKVNQINGCTFTYLKDDRKSAGLIAQDLEKVLPSAVIEDKPVFHGEEGETYKTVQYDQVIGLLVEAIKELNAKVERLENGITN